MPAAPQIVRGGLVVSPHEVEQVLLGHPAVAEVVVTGVPDRVWGEVVGAAIRLGAPLSSAAVGLSGYCRALLAAYKVPERWLFTSALPRTADGVACRATVAGHFSVAPSPRVHRLPTVGPADLFRPRPAIEDLRIPPQARRSWAPEDL